MAVNELLAKIDGQQKRINETRPLPDETVTSLRDYYKIGLIGRIISHPLRQRGKTMRLS